MSRTISVVVRPICFEKPGTKTVVVYKRDVRSNNQVTVLAKTLRHVTTVPES